jgi:hypothetical protein
MQIWVNLTFVMGATVLSLVGHLAVIHCGPIRAGSRSSSIYAEGVVTRTEFSGAQFGSANSGSGRGCGSPSPERFLSEDAERAAGGEMALDVEGVEDYGVNR